MARVFSAIDIEDDNVLDNLVEARDRLDLGFNPVEREKIHITLEFFEDLKQDEIQELAGHLKKLELEPFKAEIKSIGAFPSQEYIRVVWAGVKSDKIFKVHEKVSDNSLESDNSHEFKPHATLLRVKNLSRKRKKLLKNTMEEYSERSFGTVQVESIKLFESVMKPSGTEYRVIEEVDL